MAEPKIYNPKLDAGKPFRFDLIIKDSGVAQDVSSWQFALTLTRKRDSVVVWSFSNSDFVRPSTGRIYVSKSKSQVTELQEGEYILSFRVTNTEVEDDEWITGTAKR